MAIFKVKINKSCRRCQVSQNEWKERQSNDDVRLLIQKITQCGVTMIPSTFLILYIVQFIHKVDNKIIMFSKNLKQLT